MRLAGLCHHVRCRTGSLEKWVAIVFVGNVVRCRTGSLEMMEQLTELLSVVRCRTGSLEIVNRWLND